MPEQRNRAKDITIRGNDTRVERSFDELGKELAKGTVSRRQVLRWIGSILVGVATVWVPGVAVAQADCSGLVTTKTRCVAVTLWCRDYCGIAQEEGARPVSGWYICGVCFGFRW
jgi:hypothetical protein